MGAYLDAFTPGRIYRCLKASEIMAPVDPCKGCIMDRLESVIDPYHMVFIIMLKQLQDRFVNAIGPGPYEKSHDIFNSQGFIIQAFEVLNGSVSIGEGLEVGDKFFRLEPPCHMSLFIQYLFG